MGRTARRLVRPVAAAAILLLLVRHVGTGPFLDGLANVDLASAALAVVLTAAATACCVWRWRLVGRALGTEVPVAAGVAAYYRSQLLNSVLPGGVVGDAHRGIRHGRDHGGVALGIRTVGWERSCGQVVQLVAVLLLLVVLPSPLGAAVPVLGVVAVGAVLLALLGTRHGTGPRRPWHRLTDAFRRDLSSVLDRRVWPAALLASVLVVAAHTTTFLVAARAAGVTSSNRDLLPLVLVVLAATSVPVSLAGWGPREGVAAWAFAAAGLGASVGVGVAVVYGVISFIATLPGLAVLTGDAVRPTRTGAAPVPTVGPRAVTVTAHG